MLSRILVVLDGQGRAVTAASLEAAAMAQSLGRSCGASVAGLSLGVDTARAESAAQFRFDRLWAVTDPLLGDYAPDPYLAALVPAIREWDPDLVLFAHSYQNMDLVPRLAARLGVPLATDCVACRLDERGLLLTRQVFRGKLNADVRLRGARPSLVTLQRGAASVESLQPGRTTPEEKAAGLPPGILRWTIRERIESQARRVDLTKAQTVVGVGRGIRSQENLRMAQSLAELLGAEVGASRPVVDNEWLDRDRQIGSSGQTVAPKLYLALGISGAIQHVVGIRNSGCIVAVNSDPNAPIFNLATYGIVGDVAEVIPELIRQLQDPNR